MAFFQAWCAAVFLRKCAIKKGMEVRAELLGMIKRSGVMLLMAFIVVVSVAIFIKIIY